ncbi:MAG: multidrug effflux MFS transporter [Rhizobiaceae bacterium]|nr:multidrug effflux MFS transporter [Rhizobiaceae bacterium]
MSHAINALAHGGILGKARYHPIAIASPEIFVFRPFEPHSMRFLVMMAAFGGLPALGTDIALSGMLAISHSLDVAPGDIGVTLTAFMIGFAISPLAYGPLADRFGRKPIILYSTAIFALGGWGCATATSLTLLLGWRLVQGVGAGASFALSATVINDQFEGAVARSKLSYVGAMGLLAPLSAPTIGSLLLHLSDWRLIYWFLCVMGICVFVAIAIGLRDTYSPGSARRLTPRQIISDYAAVLTSPQSVRYIAIVSFCFACLFSYVSGSPLVLMGTYGLSPSQYGLTFALTTCGILLGSFLNGKLNARHVDPTIPLGIGLALMLFCSVVLLVGSTLVQLPLPIFLGIVVVCTFSFGLIAPNASQLALEPVARIAGTASALRTACQLAIGGVAGGIVSALYNGTAFSTVASMALFSVLACGFHLLGGKRYRVIEDQ